MATISNTPRPGYVWDATDNVWYPIGVGGHGHPDYITQATAVNPTIIDAKGDILTATAADTPARLAVGNNGETLVADSAATTGLRYSATPSASNPVINSAFNVFQRGTTFAITTPVYTADRWQAGRSGNTAGSTVTRQVTGDTTNLPNIQYCLRFARDSGSTSNATFFLNQSFESANSIAFAGKTVRLSFYARAGANYSAAGNLLTAKLVSGTGTDQNLLTAGYTGSTNVISDTATLTTTWQRFSYTGSIPSTATEVGIMFESGQSGTAGAADYFEITGVQLDIGATALPYRAYAATFQGELAACQRYYLNLARGTGKALGIVSYYNASSLHLGISYPVEMRTAPTIDQVAGTNYFGVFNDGATRNISGSWTLADVSTRAVRIYATSDTAATGQAGFAVTSNASAVLALQAEL